jgi:predicted  nucleic acid-binding Zn-ribbon protein
MDDFKQSQKKIEDEVLQRMKLDLIVAKNESEAKNKEIDSLKQEIERKNQMIRNLETRLEYIQSDFNEKEKELREKVDFMREMIEPSKENEPEGKLYKALNWLGIYVREVN